MKEINFVTMNKGKAAEVKEILAPHGIKVKQLKDEKLEIQDTVENVASFAAQLLAEKHRKPVVVEDVGLFFKAYKDFPGTFTKQVYSSIGFPGMLALLKGKRRDACFKAVVCYCEPGKRPVLFEGIMEGSIAHKPVKGGFDSLPYDQIFIAKGYSRPLSTMMHIKNGISHRRKAFTKLARWLA